jgi:hypothetical protein
MMWRMLLYPICWWRGYHLSSGRYGWRVYTGSFEVYCDTCGRLCRQPRDEMRQGPNTHND